jgi:anti-anti-sigma factor
MSGTRCVRPAGSKMGGRNVLPDFHITVETFRESRPQVRIQITKDAAFAVVKLEGRLAASHGAASLSDTVDILLTQGLQHIFVDMHLVDPVDCAGIGQLVRCYCCARARGATLTLIRAHPRVQNLLRLFRLQDHLKVFDSEQAAFAGVMTVNPRKGVEDLSSAGSHASFQQSRNALSRVSSPWVGGPEICDIAETVCPLVPAYQRSEKSGTISHYRIVQKIGEGGMGVVYQAVDTQLDRVVALKFLNQSAVGSDGQNEKLLFEAKAAAALNHPSICTAFTKSARPRDRCASSWNTSRARVFSRRSNKAD